MKKHPPAPRRMAAALALLAFPAAGLAQLPLPDRAAGSAVAAPSFFAGKVGAADYAINRGVARIVVATDRSDAPADGQSPVKVTVTLFDEHGKPLTGTALLTIEASGGRILLPGARTDELGPERRDVDKVTPGTQLTVENGEASFSLLAPATPQDVLLRVSAGAVAAQGTISFLPELRDMLAVGLIDGIISKRSLSSSDISPSRFNDGFERDIVRWSRAFNNGKANVAGRAAMFLKGTIRGDALLTAAYDSDKDTRARLMRDVNPEEFYPVYGDSSVRNFDARSSDRLYVRIDQQKSYVLYGDFATGDGFSQMTGGGAVANLQQ
ncbi:MAG: Ig-like domain-containing protein, partial [Janthinobacterium sp.]